MMSRSSPMIAGRGAVSRAGAAPWCVIRRAGEGSRRLVPIIILLALWIVGPTLMAGLTTSATAQTLPAEDRARVTRQVLDVTFNPEDQTARISATLETHGVGPIKLHLPEGATIQRVTNDAHEFVNARRLPDEEAPGPDAVDDTFAIRIPSIFPQTEIHIDYTATFDDDPSAGEATGAIHNFSVSAHVSEDGIFLSDSAAWHPVWLDPVTGNPGLMEYEVYIRPIEGWTFVASGNPVPRDDQEVRHLRYIPSKATGFRSPRPLAGAAIAGNQHVVERRVHDTPHGPVELVMQTRPENERFIPIFLDAAEKYLDQYTPLLGPFPYERFTIVENFFSSGFAFPGFTVLGPRVIPMGKRALSPGYLDHELIHNWWGNGVYADPRRGNWCEALTSYCANYGRRILDEGEEAGMEYRRGILMKLAADPETYDNAPIARFGLDPDVNRFVGYDKGSFIFMMLEQPTPDAPDAASNREAIYAALRKFAAEHLGERATWDDLRAAFEAEFDRSLDAYFETWIDEHTRPEVRPELGKEAAEDLRAQLAPGQHLDAVRTMDSSGTWIEIDPRFYTYRVLPAERIVPTLAGATGRGGTRFVADESEHPSIAPFVERVARTDPDSGENLFIIGKEAARKRRELIEQTSDPLTFDADSFTVAGQRYVGASQAVLHTMRHPDRPGRFITLFLANGESGWNRLPYMTFYTRDTTVVWDGRSVTARRVYEPDRRIRVK